MTSYVARRGEIEAYFDRTAAETWARLTSDAPLGRIRATVRAGRDRMRETLLGWLPHDLHGMRVLDAGCGTGALAVEAATRGAQVTAIDLSPTLIRLAHERAPRHFEHGGTIEWLVGDLLDAPGRFDAVVLMDSLIHYAAPDIVRVLSGLAARTDRAVLYTFAPRTASLAAIHTVGRLFPRADRAPAIEPVAERRIRRLLASEPTLQSWQTGRTHRIDSGFYKSQAMELTVA
ncbi:MAG TPA: magnesium protoporphyrin IX methyltransferase [Acidisphaera sp.]|nr:magnesium protoporphyrin IX methyltransferase [Acidisphaera sp.]